MRSVIAVDIELTDTAGGVIVVTVSSAMRTFLNEANGFLQGVSRRFQCRPDGYLYRP